MLKSGWVISGNRGAEDGRWIHLTRGVSNCVSSACGACFLLPKDDSTCQPRWVVRFCTEHPDSTVMTKVSAQSTRRPERRAIRLEGKDDEMTRDMELEELVTIQDRTRAGIRSCGANIRPSRVLCFPMSDRVARHVFCV